MESHYPTDKEVAIADKIQICRWYRFLPSPINEEERIVLATIKSRYKELGGMTAEISKLIGWRQ